MSALVRAAHRLAFSCAAFMLAFFPAASPGGLAVPAAQAADGQLAGISFVLAAAAETPRRQTAAEVRARLARLYAQGYQAVDLARVVQAHAGLARLPPRAVLLVFEHDPEQFEHDIFPLLALYDWPAVLIPAHAPREDAGADPVGRAVRGMRKLIDVAAPVPVTRGTSLHEAARQAALFARWIRRSTGASPHVWAESLVAGGTVLHVRAPDGGDWRLTMAPAAVPGASVPVRFSTAGSLPFDGVLDVFEAPAQAGRIVRVDASVLEWGDPGMREARLDELVLAVARAGASAVWLRAPATADGEDAERYRMLAARLREQAWVDVWAWIPLSCGEPCMDDGSEAGPLARAAACSRAAQAYRRLASEPIRGAVFGSPPPSRGGAVGGAAQRGTRLLRPPCLPVFTYAPG